MDGQVLEAVHPKQRRHLRPMTNLVEQDVGDDLPRRRRDAEIENLEFRRHIQLFRRERLYEPL